ncbi:hypothetical protein HY477_01785 [Candidatus Uhrbacteria bacterium]|nr:hypothetical protein [Candidatus Uhrbacteria bacterium]
MKRGLAILYSILAHKPGFDSVARKTNEHESASATDAHALNFNSQNLNPPFAAPLMPTPATPDSVQWPARSCLAVAGGHPKAGGLISPNKILR